MCRTGVHSQWAPVWLAGTRRASTMWPASVQLGIAECRPCGPRRLAWLVLNDVVQPDRVPMPPAVAARPRDDRGYPVPAITPWLDGRPMFAATSTSRTLI